MSGSATAHKKVEAFKEIAKVCQEHPDLSKCDTFEKANAIYCKLQKKLPIDKSSPDYILLKKVTILQECLNVIEDYGKY